MAKRRIQTLFSLLFDATVVIHIANRYISAHSRLRDFLPLYNHNYYTYKTGRVFYTVKGSGKPLLLIHDVLEGGSGYEWNRIEEKLAEEYTVYTLDLPGCGRSDKYGQIYTNFLFVQMTANFVRDVIKEKASVIANGYSATIPVMANIYDRDLFENIILVNPADPVQVSEEVTLKGKIYRRIIETPVYGTMIYNMHSSHEAISSRFMDRYFFNPFHVDRDLLDAYYEAAHKGGYFCKSLYASLSSGYLNVDITNAVRHLNEEKCLLIFGEGETNKGSSIRKYLDINPSLRVDICEHSAHFPHIERPDEFMDIIYANRDL